MKVFLLQDIKLVGLKGEVIKVKDGYAKNFLFPKKLAIEITKSNEAFYAAKAKKVENRSAIIASETSLLSEQISQLSLKIKKKFHDDDKLYAAISPVEVVELLSDKNIKISKSQVKFDKSIKSKGSHKVTIKLSSKLQPQFTLNVIA